jgi:uncharacterized protein DUF7025
VNDTFFSLPGGAWAYGLSHAYDLQHGEIIIYGLLWALFKPSTLVYTTCLGTGKPRCVILAIVIKI